MLMDLIRLLAVVALGVLFWKTGRQTENARRTWLLIVGMVLGPKGAKLLTQDIWDAPSCHKLISVMECGMGLMLGTEMV